MSNVWKIGTKWGYDGESVINLFLDYGCVFFGCEKECKKIGHWWDVQNGDVFAICCGTKVVALGRSQGRFDEDPQGSHFGFRRLDVENFVWKCERFYSCPAEILWIPEKLRSIKLKRDGRFYKVGGDADTIKKLWDRLSQETQKKSFDIRTRTASLFDPNGSEKPIFEKGACFHIPIYQRPYSWGLEKLRRMMEDLHQGMDDDEPLFLGTLQFSDPVILDENGEKKSYDVIDGQQRLTTFMILSLLLEKIIGTIPFGREHFENSFRTSVNKRAAQEDLQKLYDFLDEYDILKNEVPSSFQNDCERNVYIRNCLAIADLLKEFSSLDDDNNSQDIEKIVQYAKDLYSFICSKVKIVIIETRAGLAKTLKIFDTINTAGMPLGVDDIFKLHFYEYMRKKGASEQVFDEISELYESVEKYNRNPYADMRFSMGEVLIVYQRILIAKANLINKTFLMSYGNFFNQLFETCLQVRAYQDFEKFDEDLSIDDLKKIIQCFCTYYKICNQSPDLNIFRLMVWLTRYGYASNFPVIALYFDIVDEDSLSAFVKDMVKGLVPHSLYWAKVVNGQRYWLIQFLRDMNSGNFKKGDSLVDYCRNRWTVNGISLEVALNAGVDHVIAWTPKWKYLLCTLAEYLLTPESERDENLYNRLFKTEYDIEHIQPFTDEKDPQLIYKKWGDELNKIGNLALFERNLNRRVKNHPDKKQEEYGKSVYKSIKLLEKKVVGWSQEDACKRRELITGLIKKFIFA